MVSAAALLACPGQAFAEEDRALFWRVTTKDKLSCIIFGYARLPASLAPDIVRDGIRMVEQTPRLVADVPNFDLPPMNFTLRRPLLPRLGQRTAAELREILARSGKTEQALASTPGIFIVMFLAFEGQTDLGRAESVGDAIVNRATELGRPITSLLTVDEVKRMVKPIDSFIRLDDTIDDKTITQLLDLRKQVGPLGAHMERLYRDRKSQELYRFTDTLENITPLSSSSSSMRSDPDLPLSRFLLFLALGDPGFFLLPVGSLMGPDGVLERLRRQGADIEILA
ncbi:MAG TPA: hypothetical protein VG758_32535 [Hyphomicrobiaceae bacterium]|jgi:hypothetical protein|nr:hypothetical protein [Hyphomicrobiaceae bacterium]